jgi:hypothetical protein
MSFDDELTAAARTLHREWESPGLWPAIADAIAASERDEHRHARYGPWLTWAAAAAVAIATAATLVLLRDGAVREISVTPPARAGERLLSDEALADVEQAEARYIAAIEALARKVSPAVNTPSSPLAANLRERLLVIDAAIADCRAEIERNRFNAHLRRQLLSIYQEKRQTLEQILELEQHVSSSS